MVPTTYTPQTANPPHGWPPQTTPEPQNISWTNRERSTPRPAFPYFFFPAENRNRHWQQTGQEWNGTIFLFLSTPTHSNPTDNPIESTQHDSSRYSQLSQPSPASSWDTLFQPILSPAQHALQKYTRWFPSNPTQPNPIVYRFSVKRFHRGARWLFTVACRLMSVHRQLNATQGESVVVVVRKRKRKRKRKRRPPHARTNALPRKRAANEPTTPDMHHPAKSTLEQASFSRLSRTKLYWLGLA